MTTQGLAKAGSVDALLEQDLFGFTRSDGELASLVRAARAEAREPYRQLLHALFGSGDKTSERRARSIWTSIATHKTKLSTALGRAFPLRAAAIDWLYLRKESARPIRAVVIAKATLVAAMAEGRTDSLTGLPRRAEFERAVDRALRRASFVGVVVFIDLDGFKRANDTLGHARGDSMLREFAAVAREALREGDLIGRMGGDEFALMLTRIQTAAARGVAARLRTRFEEKCGHGHAGVSFSFGVVAVKKGDSAHLALQRADKAMYRQKRARKTKAVKVKKRRA